MRATRFPLALLLLFASHGCGNTCDRMCDAQADMLERCFPEWEMSWLDLSYDDREHFEERCHAVQGGALDELDRDDPARDEINLCCDRNLEVARSDADCESLLSLDCATE